MPNRPATGDEQRTYMAGERTLLAWLRTSLALMGFGFLVAKFGLFLRELIAMRAAGSLGGQSPPAGTAADHLPNTGLSLWLGVGLVAMGLLINVFAMFEYRTLMRQFAGTQLGERTNYWPHLAVLAVLLVFGVVLCGYLIYFGRN